MLGSAALQAPSTMRMRPYPEGTVFRLRMNRTQQLPTRTARILRWTRRLCSGTAALALALGMVACVDELQRNLKTPPDTLSAWPGTAVTLSGVLPDLPENTAVTIQLKTSPEDKLLAVNSVSVVPRWFNRGQRWRATLTALPQLPPGSYQVLPVARVINDRGNVQELHLHPWSLIVHQDASAAQHASPSLMQSRLGADPLLSAIVFLGLGIFAAALTPLLGRMLSRNLARHGYLLVYHAKADGDDTLLYCLDTDSQLRSHRMYPVLSAVGQLIGLAALATHSRRHCVLRLPAAQARAGCFISLRSA